MAAPAVREDLHEAAVAYLRNVDNRGIFERSEYFADIAGRPGAGFDAAFEYLTSAAFRGEAEASLATIAPTWERMQSASPERVLDAGSGPGVTTLAMARRYPEAEVVGIDVEPHALEFARVLASDTPLCSFVEAPLETFEDADGFDLIQCRMVIEHVYDPPAAIAQLSRLLRPGGLAYVEFPNYLWPFEPHVKLPMLPRSPKWILALECRATGRDAHFIEHLNFECNPVAFRRWVADAPAELEVHDLMAAKIRAVLDGHTPSAVPSRDRIVQRLNARPRLKAAAELALTTLPIAPSVMAVLRRPAQEDSVAP